MIIAQAARHIFELLILTPINDISPKRMRQIGNVEVPQEAFLAVLKLD